VVEALETWFISVKMDGKNNGLKSTVIIFLLSLNKSIVKNNGTVQRA